MGMMYAIDECINEFEFRNFVAWYLEKYEYHFVSMDDSRWSDDKKNNNDFIVVKDGTRYTVQVFLTSPITNYKLDETVIDIEKEDVLNGIIFTNLEVTDEMKKKAKKKNIEILDREMLEKDYLDYRNE